MLSESLVESFRVRLEALGLELADLRFGGTPPRPLVQGRIKGRPGGPPRGGRVDDWARGSGGLEAWPAAGGRGGPLYAPEVPSRGLERPVRWHRHWVRFVG